MLKGRHRYGHEKGHGPQPTPHTSTDLRPRQPLGLVGGETTPRDAERSRPSSASTPPSKAPLFGEKRISAASVPATIRLNPGSPSRVEEEAMAGEEAEAAGFGDAAG